MSNRPSPVKNLCIKRIVFGAYVLRAAPPADAGPARPAGTADSGRLRRTAVSQRSTDTVSQQQATINTSDIRYLYIGLINKDFSVLLVD